MIRYERVAGCFAIAGIIISFFIFRYLKSRNDIWIAASVIVAGMVTSFITFVTLGIWSDSAERPLQRTRARLQCAGYSNYTYKPLDKSNPKSIRLIELVKLSDADLKDEIYVRIKMRTASLEGPDAEPYEALSYCWGDPTRVRPLVCDDAIILVTETLYMALDRLHLETHNRILWADALCINQQDLVEKSWQVRMMSGVYRNATRVLAYLGEDDDNSQFLEPLIMQLSKARDEIAMELESGAISVNSPLTKGRQKALGIPRMTVSNIAQFLAFQFLLQRDWFCRVWIIQEISLAKDAILLCGDWEIPWATLFAAFEVSQVLPIGGQDVVDLGFDRLQRLGWSKENLSGTPLVTWLFVHRGAGATNPRVRALVPQAPPTQALKAYFPIF